MRPHNIQVYCKPQQWCILTVPVTAASSRTSCDPAQKKCAGPWLIWHWSWFRTRRNGLHQSHFCVSEQEGLGIKRRWMKWAMMCLILTKQSLHTWTSRRRANSQVSRWASTLVSTCNAGGFHSQSFPTTTDVFLASQEPWMNCGASQASRGCCKKSMVSSTLPSLHLSLGRVGSPSTPQTTFRF